MPLSLTNAPMAFQQFMNDIFSDLLDIYIIIYLDDILIYSNNMFKHHQHVEEVLKHFYKTSLYTKAEKCRFYSKSVKYLEYILSPSGLTMSNNKVKIIQDWLELKKVKDIQSFFRFCKFLLLVHLQLLRLSQTLFSLYLHNKWTNFHKLSCARKPQMRAICIYAGYTKVKTND